ncbi:MAG: ferrous iron transport protein B, partial [Victivallaceae bacterium]
ETFMADCRYGVIAGVCREAVKMNQIRRQYISDQIDKFLTNRFLGLPLFLLIMLAVFAFTFFCAQPLTDLLETMFSALADFISGHWPEERWTFVRDLLCDGIIGGVGGVLSFLPNILFLFLAIAFLEGYMARAAFIMDGCMHKFGLHGKSFIPMLLGFGCTVPAVMATRTIESRRDRLTTIMILPLMSCGARLPIYSLIIPAFFSESLQAAVLWIIYIIGVLLALLAARLLKSTLFKGDDEVFVMELPPYRMPTLRSLLIHGWERTIMYLRKAGTLILGASIILFIINTYPKKGELSKDYRQLIEEVNASGQNEAVKAESVAKLRAEQSSEMLSYTIAGRIGNTLSVAMAPLGFDWRSSSALIGAFAAKELFVAQLGIVFAVGDMEAEEGQNKLTDSIREAYTPLQGFCMMLFCLISMPCVATVAVVRRETESWALTLGQLFGLTLAAYIVTLIVYQSGLFLGL